MGRIDDIDKLDRAIKDAEISLKSIFNNIEKIDNEINILAPRKNELEKNIEFHKKSGVVPIAQEFKKSKAELSKVKVRLTMLTSDRNKANAASKEIEKIIEKYKTDHAELSKVSENNVLTGNFGGKRGKR